MAKLIDNPELEALHVITGALEPLNDDGLRRVLAYLADKYGEVKCGGDVCGDPPATSNTEPTS